MGDLARQVLALQRAAGNRAATRVLARTADDGAPPPWASAEAYLRGMIEQAQTIAVVDGIGRTISSAGAQAQPGVSGAVALALPTGAVLRLGSDRLPALEQAVERRRSEIQTGASTVRASQRMFQTAVESARRARTIRDLDACQGRIGGFVVHGADRTLTPDEVHAARRDLHTVFLSRIRSVQMWTSDLEDVYNRARGRPYMRAGGRGTNATTTVAPAEPLQDTMFTMFNGRQADLLGERLSGLRDAASEVEALLPDPVGWRPGAGLSRTNFDVLDNALSRLVVDINDWRTEFTTMVGDTSAEEFVQSALEFTRDLSGAVFACLAPGGLAGAALVAGVGMLTSAAQAVAERHIGTGEQIRWGEIVVTGVTDTVANYVGGRVSTRMATTWGRALSAEMRAVYGPGFEDAARTRLMPGITNGITNYLGGIASGQVSGRVRGLSDEELEADLENRASLRNLAIQLIGGQVGARRNPMVEPIPNRHERGQSTRPQRAAPGPRRPAEWRPRRGRSAEVATPPAPSVPLPYPVVSSPSTHNVLMSAPPSRMSPVPVTNGDMPGVSTGIVQGSAALTARSRPGPRFPDVVLRGR